MRMPAAPTETALGTSPITSDNGFLFGDLRPNEFCDNLPT
jgi:hypothetical protein